MADLGVLGALPLGRIVALTTAQTTTGTTKSYEFGIEGAPDGHAHTLAASVIGASAVPTTVTANLEASFDGGTTWTIYASAVALVASTVATALVTSVVTGPLYRFNFTTVTIGSAVSFIVYGCAN